MIFILVIDLIVVVGLVSIASRKGLEQALPFFTFFMILIPGESQIPLPGFFDLTTQRVGIVTLTVLYLVLKPGAGDREQPQRLALKYLIGLHVAWCLVSTANSVVVTASIKMMLSQVLEYYLLYAIFARTVTQVRTVQKILFALAAAITVCCIFGYFEAYYGSSVTDLFPKISYRFHAIEAEALIGRGLRTQSTFPHAILFGGAIASAIPITMHLLAFVKERGQRRFLWFGLMLMFMNIYKTFSRGPWVALMVSLALMFLLGQSTMRKYVLVIAVLAVSVMVIRPGVWDTIKNIYLETQDPESPMGSSYEYRFALLRVSRQALAADPLREIWGYGLESFYYLGLEGEFLGKPDHKFLSCDSAWIAFMVETGYVGLVLIALLLFKPALMAFWDFWKLRKPDRYPSLVFFIVMISYFFMMTNVAMYSWGQNGYMLWIVIALTMAYHRLSRLEPQVSKATTIPVEEEAPALVGAAGSYY